MDLFSCVCTSYRYLNTPNVPNVGRCQCQFKTVSTSYHLSVHLIVQYEKIQVSFELGLLSFQSFNIKLIQFLRVHCSLCSLRFIGIILVGCRQVLDHHVYVGVQALCQRQVLLMNFLWPLERLYVSPCLSFLRVSFELCFAKTQSLQCIYS